MSEDETVVEYNERVLEIANESFNLGEKIPESKIVRKVLRSLPGKFDMKVTTIEEAHDITKLKLDELFGSLLTFKMDISNRENKKDDDDELPPKPAIVPELAITDTLTVDTSVNNFDDSSKLTQKDAMVDVIKKKDKIDYAKMIANICYTSSIKPTSVNEALKDEFWINAMQEELLQFKNNNVWTLVPKPEKVNIVGTRWIFKNKTDERGHVTRNKTRLVAQGYFQV
ncbi:putative mitochondrial protein [Cucumis melo var. makuwa]|uniref:Mitochondrial protein n=1 Tax=Cucumis melo var. makuwa TaxID=1194695 RepID=A0A5D3DGL3_CUCMM|nr:putative mitochondrial protein [Cucumis melo var. makuwa]TYK22746.1 putative mitochondrial protein [Cucumis melo var. makuwa]